jgi:hypothetical protein
MTYQFILRYSFKKVTDPDEEHIYNDKIPLNNKKQEVVHRLEQRGVYEMCFELHEGNKNIVCMVFRSSY